MSEDEKGFLARWSQRKREAAKEEPKQQSADQQPAQQPVSPSEAAAGDTEAPVDLASLPKLDELTADTDLTVFFRKGVPESIRNAALRKSWALDPAIRNYVNPALDYAYDWNTPGGVPGAGELPPGTDIARMVSQVMGIGEQASSQPPVEKPARADAQERDVSPHPVAAQHQADASPPAPPVRLSEASPPSEQRADAASTASASDLDQRQDESEAERRAFASQKSVRRHGSARPK
jgi:hypothetical protein